ncbi:MAG: c-type cytochrome [Acidobacteria bacterium]|nr:c-type cytochrome [Acidobacteriota bacterium]
MSRWLTVCGAVAVSAFVFMGGAAVETASGVGAAFPAAVQETTSSTLDGVFSSAQASRGQRVYDQNCASCHGQRLRGGEMAPSLAGADFIVWWTEVRVGDLFNRIKLTMPEDAPGRLSDQEYTDVVAYLLDRSDYPAGENELSTDKAEMDKIMIVAAE